MIQLTFEQIVIKNTCLNHTRPYRFAKLFFNSIIHKQKKDLIMKKFLAVLFVVFLVAGFTNAQGKMALGLNAGIALPMGDFGDGYDMGFGGNALFAYRASSKC